MSPVPGHAVVTTDETVRLDRPAPSDDLITPEDIADPKDLARLLTELKKELAEEKRFFRARRTDFQDISLTSAGGEVRLEHGCGSRVRWDVIGFQQASAQHLTETQLNNATMWVPRGVHGPTTQVTAAGNFTVGARFQVSVATRVLGVRFFWGTDASSRTITATLWRDSDGATLATGTVTTVAGGAGVYVAEFTSPLELSGADLNVNLTVGIYDGGTVNTQAGADAVWTGYLPVQFPGVRLVNHALYSAGSARPTTDGTATLSFWVEPYLCPVYPCLREDTDNTNDDTLVLKSWVPGTATLRVESAG